MYSFKCSCGEGGLCRRSQLTGKHRPKTMCNTCVRKRPRKPRDTVGVNKEYGIYKANAKSRGLSFDLTREEFETLVKDSCYYCGSLPIKRGTYMAVMNGVDRVDNLAGYVSENTVTCCTQCNMMKKDLTQEVFINKIMTIHNHLNLGDKV